jgi:hypothetical protein
VQIQDEHPRRRALGAADVGDQRVDLEPSAVAVDDDEAAPSS